MLSRAWREVESRTIDADKVAETLGMSRAYAYKLIRRLNKEMEERGCITVPGRVSRTYFERRPFGGEGDSDVGDKG